MVVKIATDGTLSILAGTESGATKGTGTGRYPAPDDGTYTYKTWKGGEDTADRPVDVQQVPFSQAS